MSSHCPVLATWCGTCRHIRAIAAYHGNPITLLTKPRTLADQLLAHEASVGAVRWLDLNPSGRRGNHDGVGGFRRLVSQLRACDFGTVVILHHSELLAAAFWAAGIPDRRGYGWGRQRWFLNNGPFLPPHVKHLHQHTRATAYLAAAGIPLPSPEPMLVIPPALRGKAIARFGDTITPFVAIGIGSSEALRQWGTDRFIQLASVLLSAGWPNLVLVGGIEDSASATSIKESLQERGRHLHLALGWNLTDVMGLLADATFYVGNNTGVMNIAAAAGIRTYALFGTTTPFTHASQIVSVTAPDIGIHDGMKRLTLEAVLDAIKTDRGRISP